MANEKRLIDANATKARSNSWSCRSHIAGMALSKMNELIDSMPTIDAVEVVHGRWIVCGDGEYVPFMCSACGKTTSWYHAQTANYCPNCGADMRERKDNERKTD